MPEQPEFYSSLILRLRVRKWVSVTVDALAKAWGGPERPYTVLNVNNVNVFVQVDPI
jgi:hypothetical protein